jgi:hypothetical protein
MTFATLIEFAIKNWKLIGIGIIVLTFGIYTATLKYTISKDTKQISVDQQIIIDLKAGIQVQNLAMNQLQAYNQELDRKIADATSLAEKMQDTVDNQANEILLRKTNIEQTIVTLADCNAELGRIKQFMVDAETGFKGAK